MGLQIRPAETGDLEALCTLSDPPRGVDWVRSALLHAQAPTKPAVWLVACVDGERVGQARLGWFPGRVDPSWPATCLDAGWYLLGVYVRPDLRRQGIGRALTEARIEHARAQGAPWVRYWRTETNLASAATHRSWNFRRLDRPWWFPGRLDLDQPAVLLEVHFAEAGRARE